VEIFTQVIERLEIDFDQSLVHEVLRLLGSARRGLSEREMRELVVGPDSEETGNLYPVLRQLRPYLMRRGDVTGFFHDALRKAVRSGYLHEEDKRQDAYLRLADYFDRQENFLDGADSEERTPNARKVDELPFQLLRGGDEHRLGKRLQELTFVEAKAEAGLVNDLAEDFREVVRRLPEDDSDRYILKILSRAIDYEIGFLSRHPDCVFQVCWNRGWWTDAEEAACYFEVTDEADKEYLPPWERPDPKVSQLLEKWRVKRDTNREAPWVRRMLPPPDLFSTDQILLRGYWFPVAWSPSGDRLAGASWDGSVRVWKPRGGSPAVLRGHTKGVTHVAWSPSGDRLASASWDGSVRVWKPDHAEDPVILHGHESSVEHLAWAPSGNRLASASGDRTVRVWNLDSIEDPIVPHRHEDKISTTAWSPLGDRLASASWDGSVRVWGLDSPEDPIVLNEHEDKVIRVAWSPSGDRLASASEDDTMRIWNLDRPESAVVLHVQDYITHMAWSSSGDHLASAALSGKKVQVWSLSSTDDPAYTEEDQLPDWFLREDENQARYICSPQPTEMRIEHVHECSVTWFEASIYHRHLLRVPDGSPTWAAYSGSSVIIFTLEDPPS